MIDVLPVEGCGYVERAILYMYMLAEEAVYTLIYVFGALCICRISNNKYVKQLPALI